jgi:small-conductance mechanosensitive channel
MNPVGFGSAGFDLEAIFRSLASTQGAVQIACLVAVGLLAWLIARRLRARLPENLSAGFAKIGAGGANRIAFPLLFLILAWLARLILAKFYPVQLLNLAIPLIASYAAIRLAVYLLRHMIPPSAFLKSFERFITFTMWGFAVLYLTGTLSEVLAALEDIKFSVGKDKVTLRQMTEALIYATATVFVALGLSGLAEKRIMSTTTINMSSRVVITKILRALALVFGLLIAMPLVGIDLTVLSVFGGALGVGLGFGLQKIASNYVSGFIILLDRSVHLGDLVTVDNRHGIVDAIRARYTVLKSFDGTQFIIPNDTLITNVVINHPHPDCVIGVKANVTISYDSDLNVATRILLASAKSHSHVVAAPESLVLVNRLGENGIELELIAHISDQDQGQAVIRSELLATIWREFRTAGVVIAAPQREVHVIGSAVTETQMKHGAASETDVSSAPRKITP